MQWVSRTNFLYIDTYSAPPHSGLYEASRGELCMCDMRFQCLAKTRRIKWQRLKQETQSLEIDFHWKQILLLLEKSWEEMRTSHVSHHHSRLLFSIIISWWSWPLPPTVVKPLSPLGRASHLHPPHCKTQRKLLAMSLESIASEECVGGRA